MPELLDQLFSRRLTSHMQQPRRLSMRAAILVALVRSTAASERPDECPAEEADALAGGKVSFRS